MDQPVDFLTLFRDDNRHGFFEAVGRRDPFFDDVTGNWIVTNPDQVKDFLSSPNLDVSPYALDYRRISQRFAVDFEGVGFAVSNIPLCNSGDVHTVLRRRMGEYLAGLKPVMDGWLTTELPRILDRLEQPGPIDLMAAMVAPIASGMMTVLGGVGAVDRSEIQGAATVFDRGLTLSKRMTLEATVQRLRALIEERLGPDASEDDVGVRLALLLLGQDPLTGSLGYSLLDVFNAHPDARLIDMAFPDAPTATGVPHTMRTVQKDFQYGNQQFRRGDTVRILLQVFEYDPQRGQNHRMFGAGLHSCLGRPLAVALWRAMVARLSRMELRVAVGNVVPRGEGYVFASPSQMHVELFR